MKSLAESSKMATQIYDGPYGAALYQNSPTSFEFHYTMASSKETITMKGISREIKVFSVVNNKDDVESQSQLVTNKSINKELSEIEKIKNNMNIMKKDIQAISKKIDTIIKK